MGRGKQAALLKAESDSPVSQDRHLGGRPLAHALAQLSQEGERHADARSFGWRALIMCSLLLWERNPRLAQRTRENRGRMSNVLMWRFMPVRVLRVPYFLALKLQLSPVLVVQIL